MSKAKNAQAKQSCQAVIDDWDHLAVNAPRQALRAPGDKPCPRAGVEHVKHLCLCAQHAKMAREGFVAEDGRVAHRDDIRAVRRYPKAFPHGLGLGQWAREA